MSILDINDQPSDADIAAKQIISQAKNCFSIMARSFNEGSKLFWDNPKGVAPSEVANALGTNAKEIFELHYALGQLINSVKPESIIAGLSLIGQFTMNEDGTVTVIESEPVPDPIPEPSGSV